MVQAVTRKARILDVVYNASNNELVGSAMHSAVLWDRWLPRFPWHSTITMEQHQRTSITMGGFLGAGPHPDPGEERHCPG